MRIVADLNKVLQYAAIAAAAGAAGFAVAKLISDSREDDLEEFFSTHPENESFLWQPPEASDLPLVDNPPSPEHLPFEEDIEVDEIDIED